MNNTGSRYKITKGCATRTTLSSVLSVKWSFFLDDFGFILGCCENDRTFTILWFNTTNATTFKGKIARFAEGYGYTLVQKLLPAGNVPSSLYADIKTINVSLLTRNPKVSTDIE